MSDFTIECTDFSPKNKNAKMKILMLGWEFPPIYSGGLGVVSKNLSMSLAKHGVDICFALPHHVRKTIPNHEVPYEFNLQNFDKVSENILKNISFHTVSSLISSPYITEEQFGLEMKESWKKYIEKVDDDEELKSLYGSDLFEEIERFAIQMEEFVKERNFDMIHAHDWITFEAALRIKAYLDIPLLLHVHATEMDRTGQNPNPEIYNREKYAFGQADKIITVSDFTKDILVEKYGVCPDRIQTVHNAHQMESPAHTQLPACLKKKHKDEKVVMFIGRMTLQKGPDYFCDVAKKVVAKDPSIKFVMIGEGDMLPGIIKRIAAEGLQKNVFCLGFLDGEDKKKAYQNADLCIVPSVSEPFGLTALESVDHGTPLILSTSSGVKEVIGNALKVDFWDVAKMSEYVLGVLKYPVLQKVLAEKAYEETRKLSWSNQAKEVKNVYESLVR